MGLALVRFGDRQGRIAALVSVMHDREGNLGDALPMRGGNVA
ncbi:hypothetical protein [Pasteuria penetrans]|nr:hypothetical protein [Pasteuria penetrans]